MCVCNYGWNNGRTSRCCKWINFDGTLRVHTVKSVHNEDGHCKLEFLETCWFWVFPWPVVPKSRRSRYMRAWLPTTSVRCGVLLYLLQYSLLWRRRVADRASLWAILLKGLFLALDVYQGAQDFWKKIPTFPVFPWQFSFENDIKTFKWRQYSSIHSLLNTSRMKILQIW